MRIASEMCLSVSSMSLKVIIHFPSLLMTYVCRPGSTNSSFLTPNSFLRMLLASVRRSYGSRLSVLKALFLAGGSEEMPKTYTPGRTETRSFSV